MAKVTHLRFDKYTSIENTYRASYMEAVMKNVPSDMIWDVTEKVHGANCCIITDGITVEFAKRSGIVGEGGGFFSYEIVLAEHQERILNAFKYVKEKFETEEKPIKMVQFYGELFGGGYPHEDVPNDKRFGTVQKGIYYAPYQSFYGFDIALVHGNGTDANGYRTWLNPDEESDVYAKNDIFFAKSLFRGTLKECLEYANEFQTNIPTWLGLPPIEGNICEGVVLKPMIPQFFKNGDRVVLKNKNERFSEKKNGEKKERKELPSSIVEAIELIGSYINDSRLCNVISHEGEFDMPRGFGNLIKLFTEDILNDFVKDNMSLWNDMEKATQKVITKAMTQKASVVIKQHYGMH